MLEVASSIYYYTIKLVQFSSAAASRQPSFLWLRRVFGR